MSPVWGTLYIIWPNVCGHLNITPIPLGDHNTWLSYPQSHSIIWSQCFLETHPCPHHPEKTANHQDGTKLRKILDIAKMPLPACKRLKQRLIFWEDKNPKTTVETVRIFSRIKNLWLEHVASTSSIHSDRAWVILHRRTSKQVHNSDVAFP